MRIAWTPSDCARCFSIASSLEGVAPHAALHEEQVQAHAAKDDEEHHRRHRRPHRWVAELQLVAEKGAVEEGAENVGGEIRPGERALDRIDEVEGVKVPDEGQDRHEPDGRQHKRQLDVQEYAHMAEAVDPRPSHGANQLPKPTAFSAPSATPHRGDRIRFQEKPTMTTESIVGRKMMVR